MKMRDPMSEITNKYFLERIKNNLNEVENLKLEGNGFQCCKKGPNVDPTYGMLYVWKGPANNINGEIVDILSIYIDGEEEPILEPLYCSYCGNECDDKQIFCFLFSSLLIECFAKYNLSFNEDFNFAVHNTEYNKIQFVFYQKCLIPKATETLLLKYSDRFENNIWYVGKTYCRRHPEQNFYSSKEELKKLAEKIVESVSIELL